MTESRPAEDRAFERFVDDGDTTALAEVFDRTAPALLAYARRVSGDDHRADDLLQQTFVAAIESRERWDRERPVLPWLLGALAYRARNLRRHEQRRTAESADPAQLAASAADPTRDATGTELARAVDDAIARLPEPFGPVVALHVRNGLTAKEIATSLRRPAGTVRTQLVRGLRQLRAALPRELTPAAGSTLAAVSLGALADVRAAVLDAGARVAAASTGGATAGGIGAVGTALIMNKLFLTCAATAAALLTALFVVDFDDRDEEPPTPPLAAASSVAPADAAATARTDAAALRRMADADGPSSTAPSPTAPEATTARLRLRFRRAWNDEPIPNVQVHTDSVLAHETETAPDGAIDLLDLAPGRVTVGAADLGWSETFDLAAGDTVERTVELPPRIETEVRVTTAAGEAVDGAAVYVLRRTGDRPTREQLGRTDADGRCTVRTARGFCAVRADADGYEPAAPTLLLATRPRRSATLTLGDVAHRVAFVVVAPDGRPAAGALVAVARTSGRPTMPIFGTADDDGRVRLDLAPGPRTVLAAWRPGPAADHNAYAFVDVTVTGSDETTHELALLHGAGVTGVARSTTGEPLAQATVTASWTDDRFPPASPLSLERTVTTDADGRFEALGLMPGRTMLRLLDRPHRADQVTTLVPGRTFDWQPTVSTGQAWSVEVVDATGEPLPDWVVALQSAIESAGAEQATDAAGVATFEGLRDDVVDVWVHPPAPPSARDGSWRDPLPAVRVDGARVGDRLRITIAAESMPTATIVGRVLDPDGAPAGNAEITLLRRFDDGTLNATVRPPVAADGTFRWGPTSPGAFVVTAEAEGAGPSYHPHAVASPNATLDLGTIQLPRPSTLTVRLRGELATRDDVVVRLRVADFASAAPLQRVDDVWRAPRTVPPGAYTIEVASSVDETRVLATRDVTVTAGTAVELELP